MFIPNLLSAESGSERVVKARIIIVEDEPDLARQLKTALGDAGYAVDYAPDGEEAQFLGDTEPYDAIVLDLGLPKIDGVSVLEKWRRDGITTPVLILTARAAWSEKVAGFDAKPGRGRNQGLKGPLSIDFARTAEDGPWVITGLRGKTPLGEATVTIRAVRFEPSAAARLLALN